ncbi:MAG: hypothetical protein ACLKAK_06250 [Alkaliphilus sp.]
MSNLDNIFMKAIFNEEFRELVMNSPQSIRDEYNLNGEEYNTLLEFGIENLKNTIDRIDREVIQPAAAWCNNSITTGFSTSIIQLQTDDSKIA